MINGDRVINGLSGSVDLIPARRDEAGERYLLDLLITERITIVVQD